MPTRNVLLVALVCLGTPALAGGPVRAHKAAVAKPSWSVTGQLIEACSCNAACPCWFGSMPTRSSCSGDQVIFLKSGKYGNINVGGLAIAEFVKSPDGTSMMESFGNFDFDNVYIDQRATPSQRKALVEIASHLFPQSSKKRTVKYVPISKKVIGKEFVVKVGTVSTASGHLIDGGFAGPPKVVNPPLADPTHKSYEQGIATRLTFTDAGQDWDFKGTNFMINNFTVTSGEYAKFEAEMEKKMKAMGKG